MHTCTRLHEEVRYVHLFNIDDFSVPKAAVWNNKDCIKSRCSVDGYDWEIRFYPSHHTYATTKYLVALELAFVGEASRSRSVTATLTGRPPSRLPELPPLADRGREDSVPSVPVPLGPPSTGVHWRWERPCTSSPHTTFADRGMRVVRDPKATLSPPPPDLHRHLGELRRNQAGADVTFTVFMAEFFGAMEERNAQRVEVQPGHGPGRVRGHALLHLHRHAAE
ncbi:unnamed protein product [Urochloa humidicola]